MVIYLASAAETALIVLLGYAVVVDVKQRRVPNSLCMALIAVGLAYQTVGSGINGLASGAGGMAVGFLILFPLYVLKGMGAGDVKLLAAACSFLGPPGALAAGALSLLVGGTLGLALIGFGALRRATPIGSVAALAPQKFADYRKRPFPYAAAIAAGVLISMWHIDQINQLVPGIYQ
jgi:prepilin peptidase CpaA